MILRVGIENNNDNRSIAWALEHPGCFAYGRDAREAEAAMQKAARDYAGWVHAHGMSWMDAASIEVQVEETFDVYMAHPDPKLFPGAKDYMIESFFRCDEGPLTGLEVEHAAQLLDWCRQDLLESLKGLSDDKLNQTYPGERWSINGILKHVAHGEWFYQERVGYPFPEQEDDLPPDPLRALELVRSHFTAVLPEWEGLQRVVELEGERWSPRKALRRAAWHERDHTHHIRKLI